MIYRSNMKPITVTIDVSKINKDKITTRTYTDKNGNEVTQRLYKMEVVPLKEKKILKEGSSNGKEWSLLKTHFVKEYQTKDEKDAKAETNFIGDATSMQSLAEIAEDAMKEQVWEDYQIRQRNPEYPTPSEQGMNFKMPTADELDEVPF